MDFTGSLIHEFNSLPAFRWLWLISVAVGAGVVNVLICGKKITTRLIITRSLLAAYFVFILMETIIGRKPGIASYELVPFWSYRHPELRTEIILNYILFIPLGFLLYLCFGEKRGVKVVLIGFLLSASIESIQLVFRIGLFEFDDMIGNTIGCLIGAVVGKTCGGHTKNRKKEVRGKEEMNKPAYDGLYNRCVKRILDFVITGIALLFLWPFYLIILIAIALEDGFPVFYRADRGGYKGKPFKICKFRSMVKNADKIGGGTTALNDPRITKVGNILRKTKLDEIPQIGQVFLGKMSLIGPRPELLRYVNQYEGDEKDILQVRPGITDFSSVEFINLDEIVGGENADEMYEKYVLKKKNALRVKYAHQVSFRTDVYILFKTLAAVSNKSVCFIFKNEHK